MTDKTEILESLGKFIDCVATEEEGDQELMKEFINYKSKNILEFTGDSKIQLNGDDVMVNGKKVGEVKVDHDNMESGIDFVSMEGDVSKEFDDMQEFYSYLADHYNVKEGEIKLQEGRVEDAVLKQKAGKSARAKRWSEVRKKPTTKDGSMGDYETNDQGQYKDPHKSKHGEEQGDGMKDKRHLKGYYDSTDVRRKHKDPVRGGSDAAHAGSASDLDTDKNYDSHDVRKQHGS